MRTHYRNGDHVVFRENGCDGCSPCSASAGGNHGIVHEQGCHYAWRDHKRACRECGVLAYLQFPNVPCADCQADPLCSGCGEHPCDCVCAERRERDAEMDAYRDDAS